MKKIILGLMALVACAVSAAAFASDMKIGVIDVRRIVQESKQVQEINATLQKNFKPRQEKIIAKQKALEGQVAKLKRDDAVLGDKEKSAFREQIMKDKRDLERLEQDYQQDLVANQNKEMQNFFAKLKKVVDQFATEKGFDLVLQRDNVPYINSKANLDITNDVLKSLS